MKYAARTLSILWLARMMILPAAAFDVGSGSSGSFLDFGASAQSLAMGGSEVAGVDDASAVYSNPAGLRDLGRKDLVLLYANTGFQSAYNAAFYAQPTSRFGAFGVGYIGYQSSGFTKRNDQGADVGSFNDSRTGILASHSFRLNGDGRLGLTAEYVREQVDVYSDSSYGLDLGFVQRLSARMRVGLYAENLVAPSLKLSRDRVTFNRKYQVGLQRQFARQWTAVVDVVAVGTGRPALLLGAEWVVTPGLAIRGGFKDNEVATGLGAKLGDLNLDYAFSYNTVASDYLGANGALHRFGVHYAFGRTAPLPEPPSTQPQTQDAPPTGGVLQVPLSNGDLPNYTPDPDQK